MADQFDAFDVSGLVPNAAPWQLPPDAGISINDTGWRAPTFGGDVSNTTAYPSQEPRQAAEWPRDGGFGMVPTTDTGQG